MRANQRNLSNLIKGIRERRADHFRVLKVSTCPQVESRLNLLKCLCKPTQGMATPHKCYLQHSSQVEAVVQKSSAV